MTTTLSPFVKMLFPEDPFGRGSLDLYTKYLRNLTVKQAGDVEQPGVSSRNISAQKGGFSFFNSVVTLEVFDPEFYVIESYFVNNARSSDLWFGWVDDEGKIHNAYKFSVQLHKITPKLTPTGSAIRLEMTSNLAAQRGPGSMLRKVVSQSRTFIAGGSEAKFAADKKLAADRRQYLNSKGTRKGPLPEPARHTYYYSRISDVVSFVCDEAGLESEIDQTPIMTKGPSGSGAWFQFLMVNQTPMQFLEELATYASNPDYIDGLSNDEYHVWVDENSKVFFKSSKLGKARNKKPYTINYLSDNTTTIDDFVNKRDPKGGRPTIVVDLDIDINIAPFADALVGVKVVGRDPTSKSFTGAHISGTSPVDKTQARKVLGLDDIRNSVVEYQGKSRKRTAIQSADNNESENLRKNNIWIANRNDDVNWFIYEDAQTLIDNPDPKYSEQLRLSATETSGPVDSGVGASKYAQYVTELGARGDASIPPEGAQNAISKSDLDKADSDSKNTESSDPTLTGNFEVQPHYDRSGITAANLYSAAMDKVLEGSVTIFGDTSVKIQDTCNLYINIPLTDQTANDAPSLHFTSGEYTVKSVSHVIDQSTFTTQLQLVRESTVIKEEPGTKTGGFFGPLFDALKDPSGSGRAEREVSASIGAGGEGNLPEQTGEVTNAAAGQGSAPPAPGGGGGGGDFGGNPPSPSTSLYVDTVDFDLIDLTQLSPVRSAYADQQGGESISPAGPNVNRTSAAMFDPDGAIEGKNNRKVDIFGLLGSKTKPEVDGE